MNWFTALQLLLSLWPLVFACSDGEVRFFLATYSNCVNGKFVYTGCIQMMNNGTDAMFAIGTSFEEPGNKKFECIVPADGQGIPLANEVACVDNEGKLIAEGERKVQKDGTTITCTRISEYTLRRDIFIPGTTQTSSVVNNILYTIDSSGNKVAKGCTADNTEKRLITAGQTDVSRGVRFECKLVDGQLELQPIGCISWDGRKNMTVGEKNTSPDGSTESCIQDKEKIIYIVGTSEGCRLSNGKYTRIDSVLQEAKILEEDGKKLTYYVNFKCLRSGNILALTPIGCDVGQEGSIDLGEMVTIGKRTYACQLAAGDAPYVESINAEEASCKIGGKTYLHGEELFDNFNTTIYRCDKGQLVKTGCWAKGKRFIIGEIFYCADDGFYCPVTGTGPTYIGEGCIVGKELVHYKKTHTFPDGEYRCAFKIAVIGVRPYWEPEACSYKQRYLSLGAYQQDGGKWYYCGYSYQNQTLYVRELSDKETKCTEITPPGIINPQCVDEHGIDEPPEGTDHIAPGGETPKGEPNVPGIAEQTTEKPLTNNGDDNNDHGATDGPGGPFNPDNNNHGATDGPGGPFNPDNNNHEATDGPQGPFNPDNNNHGATDGPQEPFNPDNNNHGATDGPQGPFNPDNNNHGATDGPQGPFNPDNNNHGATDGPGGPFNPDNNNHGATDGPQEPFNPDNNNHGATDGPGGPFNPDNNDHGATDGPGGPFNPDNNNHGATDGPQGPFNPDNNNHGATDGPQGPFNPDNNNHGATDGPGGPFNPDNNNHGATDGPQEPFNPDNNNHGATDGPGGPFNPDNNNHEATDGPQGPFNPDNNNHGATDGPQEPFNPDNNNRGATDGPQEPFNPDNNNHGATDGPRGPFNPDNNNHGATDGPGGPFNPDNNNHGATDGPGGPFNPDNNNHEATDGPQGPFNPDNNNHGATDGPGGPFNPDNNNHGATDGPGGPFNPDNNNHGATDGPGGPKNPEGGQSRATKNPYNVHPGGSSKDPIGTPGSAVTEKPDVPGDNHQNCCRVDNDKLCHDVCKMLAPHCAGSMLNKLIGELPDDLKELRGYLENVTSTDDLPTLLDGLAEVVNISTISPRRLNLRIRDYIEIVTRDRIRRSDACQANLQGCLHREQLCTKLADCVVDQVCPSSGGCDSCVVTKTLNPDLETFVKYLCPGTCAVSDVELNIDVEMLILTSAGRLGALGLPCEAANELSAPAIRAKRHA